jgi:hypothetical protein
MSEQLVGEGIAHKGDDHPHCGTVQTSARGSSGQFSAIDESLRAQYHERN